MFKNQQMNRREVLKTTVGLNTVAFAGCLRLEGEGGEEEVQENGGVEGGTQENGEIEGDTQENGGDTYTMERFFPVADSFSYDFDADTVSGTPSELTGIDTTDELIEIEGIWTGDEQVFADQPFARYDFEILENGSVILSSNEYIIMVYYPFRAAQTEETFFVTYHPSINPAWEFSLKLEAPSGDLDVSPDISQNSGVFEADLSQLSSESGTYNWQLEVSTSDDHTYIIGENHDMLISINQDENDGFPTRTEAIEETSGDPTASSPPTEPSGGSADGLIVDQKASYWATSGPTHYITQDVSVDSNSPIEFTANHEFRINNHTTNSSIIFSLHS